MNLLIVGNGGREHALAWKLAQSPEAERIFVTSTCAGIDELAEPVGIRPNNVELLGEFALQNGVDFTVVGSDQPIADGIADHFQDQGLQILAPNRRAASIESSKSFAKDLVKKLGIPTANFVTFKDAHQARAYLLGKKDYPLYIKADGPAEGKGAIEARTPSQAAEIAEDILEFGAFGVAGNEIVVEDFLEGYEVSLHAISDGENSVILPLLQDYKKAQENDVGPNTGSMGTIGPIPLFNKDMVELLGDQFIDPIIHWYRKNDNPYKGVLYAGIKLTPEGPKLVEYNARFGDSEAQVYMRLFRGDLLPLLIAAHDGNLDEYEKFVRPVQGYVNCVNVVSGGYPGKYETNYKIDGIERAQSLDGVEIFHAGTRRGRKNSIRTAGGRVLNVTCLRESLPDAVEASLVAAEMIDFEGARFRNDIGIHAYNTRPC